jgi:hypothetical protein
MLLAVPALHAQGPPPINNTVALEGTVDETYKAANTIAVKTVDGIRHLFRLTEKTTVHGAEAGADALRGLETGSTVVVHYTTDAGKQAAVEVDRIDGKGLKSVQGTVTKVDRDGKTIAIQLNDGTRQTLRLTDRAAETVSKDLDASIRDTTTVVVYYTDEGGQRVAHFFKKIK